MNKLMILLALPLGVSAAPSFDCGKAQSSVEQLICADKPLQELDRQLHLVYHTALSSSQDKKLLRAYQRGWIKGHDECWKSSDVRSCVEQNYQLRISELQLEAKLVQPSLSHDYQCDEQRIAAQFYNQTALPAVRLTFPDGSNDIGFRSISASGAKYQGQNWFFWTSKKEALYGVYGQPDVQCQQVGN